MNSRVVVQNFDGSQKWEVPFDTWSFTEELNRGVSGTLKFTEQNIKAIADVYNITPQFIFYATYREVYIYDEENNLIFGGYLAEPSVSKDSQGKKVRTIAVKDFFQLLAKRRTNKPPVRQVFFASDFATDIAWALIDYTQSLPFGDLGITRGSHPDDEDNQRTFKFHTIKQAIEKLTNNETKGGIDIEMTPQKVFNTFYPQKGSVRPNLELRDGFNINSYQIKTNFVDAMANEVQVYGEGQDEDMALALRTSDDEFKEAFFLLEEGLSEKDTSTQENLDKKGDKFLETFQAPTNDIQITCRYDSPKFTEYSTGDSIKIIIPDESINGNYRLRQRTVNSGGEVTNTFLSQ